MQLKIGELVICRYMLTTQGAHSAFIKRKFLTIVLFYYLAVMPRIKLYATENWRIGHLQR